MYQLDTNESALVAATPTSTSQQGTKYDLHVQPVEEKLPIHVHYFSLLICCEKTLWGFLLVSVLLNECDQTFEEDHGLLCYLITVLMMVVMATMIEVYLRKSIPYGCTR